MSVRDGEAERDRALAEVEIKHAEAIERGVEIISRWAARGREFSANDVRAELNEAAVDAKARGALFGRAVALGIVRRVPGALVRSSDTGTHGKPVSCYVGTSVPLPPVRDDLVTVPVKRDPAGRFTTTPPAEDDAEPLFEMSEVLR